MVGKTKQGKSKLLEHLARQLIALGQGCGVLDPHSDLADDLLAALHGDLADPALRARVIYLQPGRTDTLVPFNVLHSPHDPYTTAQHVLEAFRRTWPETLAEAPRFTNILLAALLVLIQARRTLVELPRFLTDPAFREPLLARSQNAEAVRFFRDRYDRWGREQALMVEAVLNKVGALALNPILRRMLGTPDNALPFRRILDEGKVLLVDLGRVDGETRRLLGSLIMTGLEQAALSRKDVPRAQRRPFYFLLDEFQDYCANAGSTQTLSRMLSECRKFGLHLGLAHQTVGQLADAQLKVVFASGRETARQLVGELHQPSLTQVKHDVRDLDWRERSHPLYYTLPEQWERLIQDAQRLPPRVALVQRPGRAGALRLRTVTLPTGRLSPEALADLQRDLASSSGRPIVEVDTPDPAPALDHYEPIGERAV
ncbi:MAG: type IV secretory system conjugative DNA transfer family protein [Myxococcales bacterium]|nr:type IV secretory system conjugative DNA transfer family protein [Myxococcales bacterium]